jgi:transcriptional regulator with XRE-family HTH domain
MKEAGGPSQRQLAFTAKLRPSTITRWVSGETKNIRPHDIGAGCSILGVRADWLLLGVGPMKEDRVAESEHPYSADGLTPAKRIILRAIEADLSRMTDEQAEAWFVSYQKTVDKPK